MGQLLAARAEDAAEAKDAIYKGAWPPSTAEHSRLRKLQTTQSEFEARAERAFLQSLDAGEWIPHVLQGLANLIEDPGKHHSASKRLDNAPQQAGTQQLAASRAITFHLTTGKFRQVFYEPLSSYDTILAAMQLAAPLIDKAQRHRTRAEREDAMKYVDHVGVSFRMFRSARTAPGGRIPMPTATELNEKLEAHAVALCGSDDAGESLAFVNSWGAGWGDHGYGLLSHAYVDAYLQDAWLFRSARWGPTSEKLPLLTEASTDEKFIAVWRLDNPRQELQLDHRNRAHRLVTYQTWSLQEACPVDVIEIRRGPSFLRIAWAFLFHLGGSNRGTSLLKEFFVWPAFRRQGYGILLDRVAGQRARLAGSHQLRLVVHDVDGQLQVRAATRAFATAAGYKWLWRRSGRPSIEAICEKAL